MSIYRYGRKTVLIVGTLLCAVFGIARAFSANYELFCILEFLDAAALSGTYVCAFLLGKNLNLPTSTRIRGNLFFIVASGVELVGPKKRVLAGTIIWCFYPIGVVITAAFAWLITSWR